MVRRIILAISVITIASLVQKTAANTTHVIGGSSLGWQIHPFRPLAYATWASTQTFTVGDVLVFNFTTGEEDVALVTKEAYLICNSDNPISLKIIGPANFTLNSVGDYYFICTIGLHCTLGQKLAINVVATVPSPSPPPAPAPAPVPAPALSPPGKPDTYTVGDDLGWLVPPDGAHFYATWAKNKTFIVGDTLVFNFDNGTQDVAVVTKEAYETCNTSSAISVLTTSPANVKLTTTGEYFFTSTYPGHCTSGQRLAINVTAGASSPASTPSSSNIAPLPPPPSSIEPLPPSTTISPSPIASAPPPPPPPPSLASAQVVDGFYIALLCIVAVVLVY